MPREQRFAGVEAGGTSFVVAIAEGTPDNIVERADFPTTTPEEVMDKCIAWLKVRKFDSLGIASFGPIDLHTHSKTYGFITSTPKVLWTNTDVLGKIVRGLGLKQNFPVAWETDVNAPAMAEYDILHSRGTPVDSVAYVTVGTGCGIGLVFRGMPVHGLLHGEGGHISVPRCPGDDYVPPKTMLKCEEWNELETMVNSQSLAARANCSSVHELKDLPDDHPVWDVAAHYLACLCANTILLCSPEKIVLSGGVLKRSILFPKIRERTRRYLNSYIDVPRLTTDKIDQVIVPSDYGNNAGIIGALFIGKMKKAEMKTSHDDVWRPAPMAWEQTGSSPTLIRYLSAVAFGAAVTFVASSLLAKKR
eukprot:CAMPEP_0185766428 /NCGR_PEP_ID=MMETSP1174-20130828/36963_1 /TAXON_ID=35687 /ORGANISM="Dictyocha speculum, Strain CCMP1381" /LENGTH=361 /DNA_ID=CAMNT_0028450107 /DNA_START=35 /DNA_END=1120 /DNA_ORIENTATION=-